MSNQSNDIASAKARSKCRGPWFSKCSLCGESYKTSQKAEHLENDCEAYRRGIVLKKALPPVPQIAPHTNKPVHIKRKLRKINKAMGKVQVITGKKEIISALMQKPAKKELRPTPPRTPFAKDGFLNNLGKALEGLNPK
jgi:hypothetical protein